MLYSMGICNKLLTTLKINSVDPSKALMFFGAQAKLMLDCPPNYGTHKNSKFRKYNSEKVWILKGFYPGTSVLFKISLVPIDHVPGLSDTKYYAKVSMPPIQLGKHIPASEHINSEQVDAYVKAVTEHEVFGTEAPALVEVTKLNSPKCISPRGMPVFSLNKKV